MYASVSNLRFRSTTSTWLDALLDDPDTLKLLNPNSNLNPEDYIQPTTPEPGFYGGGGGVGAQSNSAAFQRVSSSPAEFLSSTIDGYSPRKRYRQCASKGGLTKANSSIEMEMDKLLEDTVPYSVRAKRGFATHPRSIAERVRRTKISDRIRKLQELVPDMDKQSNTADMLEEAVEYVKTLQRQIQELTAQQQKCKCSAKSQV